MFAGSAESLPASPDRFGNLIEIDDVPIDDRILGQILDGIPFEPELALGAFSQLDHLDRRRTDVEPDQWPRFGIEDRKIDLQEISLSKP